jgi:TolA-binding protein
MMRKVALGATAVLLTATLGCGGSDRADLGSAVDTAAVQNIAPPQETGDAVEAPRSYGFEDRQDFAQSVRQRLAELDRQTGELTNQAKSTGGSVSDRALANIRSARRAAARNLGRIDAATADNWEEIRGRVDQAVESLAEAVEGAYPK